VYTLYTYSILYMYSSILRSNIIWYYIKSSSSDPTRVVYIKSRRFSANRATIFIYLYTPKRIVCLISRPQWALNDPAAAAASVRSLPRLMTAVRRCGPFNAFSVYATRNNILLYACECSRRRRPPLPKTLYPVIFRSVAPPLLYYTVYIYI